ncbi:DUF2933 domain-containing protein [Thermoanaerobacterium sp. RBIITD]|uniref:DUF2933 domain-containing protein n=1 Tax=Thermoanaerobacterium sp. RBIITD TaxID=1550240 RepID=UPI000BB808F1|nr:DUF2933 domain-containing protein [Thermoanaerobacterium sp. RBIITD]SNX54795.1 Protein of unknown function [Thermoanaerobacterium sp. RBIITD]
MKFLSYILPFLFLLLCPLMHLFIMKGMHDHNQNHDQEINNEQIEKPEDKENII